MFTADCLPVALARANGDAPAIAALHVGWRGLLGGIVETAVAALGGGPLAAVIGPGIGPCCYEVGEDVARTRSARASATRSSATGRLDLWSAAEQALRAAGVEHVSRVDLCTSCNPSSSSRTAATAASTGRQGLIAYVA